MWPHSKDGAHNINAVKRCLESVTSTCVEWRILWGPIYLFLAHSIRFMAVACVSKRQKNECSLLHNNEWERASEWRAAQHFICIPSLLLYRVFLFFFFRFFLLFGHTISDHHWSGKYPKGALQYVPLVIYTAVCLARSSGCDALSRLAGYTISHTIAKEYFIGQCWCECRACANALGGVNGRRNICE